MVKIIVNGREQETSESHIDYDGAVRRAGVAASAGVTFTVVWRSGHGGGSLVPGGPPVAVEDGLVLSVAYTGGA